MSSYAELMIKVDEGFKSKPYYCTENYPTIGYGERIGDKFAPLGNETRTKSESLKFVRERIAEVTNQLRTRFPQAWGKCNEQRQAVLIGMAYQLGITGISAFKNMWSCLARGDFEGASKEMVNSRWYIQTKNRALRYSQQMRTGTMHVYYLTEGSIQ